MNEVVLFYKTNFKKFGMIFTLIIIMLLFQVLTGGILFKPLNLTNLIQQNSYILILTIGMLLVILTGNIDLSVGSIVAFIGASVATMLVRFELSPALAVMLGLLLGLLIGAWQGFWIAYFKIPSFIVTLAGMLIFRGLTLAVLQGQSVGPFPSSFQIISSKFLPNLFSIKGLHGLTVLIGLVLIFIILLHTLVSINKKNLPVIKPVFICNNVFSLIALALLSVTFATYRGFPNILVFLIILIIIYSFITQKMVLGRQIYAVGGNIKAAKLSGLRTERILFLVYCNMGLISAVAGIIFAARLNVATPKAGQSFELDAIAACYIGGASTIGGLGTIIGAIIGGLVMGVLNNGMSILGVSIDWQQTIKGLVLLLAVIFDLYSKRKAM